MLKAAFSVMIGMEDKGVHSNFPAAFKQFWEAIMVALEGGTSYQWLETANYLVMFTEDGQRLPLDFYDARDLAYDIGLLEQVESGKPNVLEQPTMENWEVYVAERYQRVPEEMMLAMQCDLMEHLGRLLKTLDEIGDLDGDDEARNCLMRIRSAATYIREETKASLGDLEPESPSATT